MAASERRHPSRPLELCVRFIFAIAFALFLLAAGRAEAVPSYAVQTAQPCSACHVGGFGPQLTPFGRQFKLEGYTLRGTEDFVVPLSGMAVASFVHTSADQSPPVPHYATNDNFTLDQANVFVAGGFGDHFGSFAQFTYDGVGRSFAWDNLDVRATDHTKFLGQNVLVGLSLNNNPGVQDPWNTMAAWGFPYTDSDLSPAPAAGTVVSGGLAQSVLGVSAYAWWNAEIYTEAAVYWTPGRGFLRAMGVDASEGGGALAGAAPYFRIAYEKQFGDQNFDFGGFAFLPRLYPGGDKSTGKSDHFTDLGVDASYQFMGTGEHIFQINAIYTHEAQSLDASALLDAALQSNSLNDLRADASYYWHNTIGFTAGYFNTWGSADPLLYADNSTFKPDSSGFILQLDATPFGNGPSPLGPRFNMRVGIQYRLFTRFDGASSNYDGLGHNASDNNTLRVFTWFVF
jgi:hypothetical protein